MSFIADIQFIERGGYRVCQIKRGQFQGDASGGICGHEVGEWEDAPFIAAVLVNSEETEEKPWWFPELAEGGGTALGWKYKDTWDGLKDAREQFESLADAYLALLAE